MEGVLKSKTYKWTIFYFITSVAFFALLFFVSFSRAYPSEGVPEEGALEGNILSAVLLLVSSVPAFTIILGKKTPRNWKRLLGWIIVEAIYNPILGIPVWVAWTRKDNKSRYGDEAAFKKETIEAQVRRDVAKEKSRKLATKMVAANAALVAYKKLSPEQQENAIQAGLHLGALAALNPNKAKQVKNAISNLGNSGKASSSNTMERMKELNLLFENQLISKQEFESKKSEILSQL